MISGDSEHITNLAALGCDIIAVILIVAFFYFFLFCCFIFFYHGIVELN